MSILTYYITEIRARLSAATPGPWHIANETSLYNRIEQLEEYADVHGPKYHHADGDIILKQDAELIAHAPDDLERLTKVCESLQDTLEEIIKGIPDPQGYAVLGIEEAEAILSHAQCKSDLTDQRCILKGRAE